MDPVSEEVLRSVSDSLVKNKATYTKTINLIVENAKTKINVNASKMNRISRYSLLQIKPVFNILNKDLIFKVKQYKTSSKTISLFKELEEYTMFFNDCRIFRTDYIPETISEYCSLIDRNLTKAYYDYINNYKYIMNGVKDSGISISTLKFYLKNGFIPSKKVFDKDSLKHIAVNSLFIALILYFFTTVLIWLIH